MWDLSSFMCMADTWWNSSDENTTSFEGYMLFRQNKNKVQKR